MTHHGRRASGKWQRAWRWSLRALGPLCALLAVIGPLAALAPAGQAAASGFGGAVTFDPQSGPVGAQVTVTITAEPPGPTPYLLSISLTDPAASKCANGVTLSDAPKIIVMPGQPTTTTFSWPAAFFSGAYYLCAIPAGGQKGPTVWSRQQFFVTGVSAPGSAPTGRDSGVAVHVPGGAVVAGHNFTLTVDVQAALGGNAPTTIMLLSPTQFSQVQVAWAQVGQDGAVYTYVVTVPADTPPGMYEAQVLAGDGEVSATSNQFQVVSSVAVSRGGPRSSPPQTVRSASPLGALLVAAIALLLALAVASLAAPALRRWHQVTRSP